MKIQEFFDAMPDLTQAEDAGDCYCIVYFSREEDAYHGKHHLDSGDALLIIEELIGKYGLDPEVIASMAKSDKAMTLRI